MPTASQHPDSNRGPDKRERSEAISAQRRVSGVRVFREETADSADRLTTSSRRQLSAEAAAAALQVRWYDDGAI